MASAVFFANVSMGSRKGSHGGILDPTGGYQDFFVRPDHGGATPSVKKEGFGHSIRDPHRGFMLSSLSAGGQI
jgi:hypothetical protein